MSGQAILKRSLKHAAADGGQDLVRLRTQCIAAKTGARLENPRKPYLIKALLKNGWGGTDGQLNVSDNPIWLKSTDDDLSIAKAVTLGTATKWLPSIYISATQKSSWLLSEQEIEKLAYDVGGIAHVVVEPDRAFSFDLQKTTEGRNAYGGAIGLCIPEKGIIRRYYIGWHIEDVKELVAAVRAAASNVRSHMPAFGWDWTELQEQALRAQRERNRNQLTLSELENLYQEEIKNLEDRNRNLEARIQELSSILESNRPTNLGADDSYFSNDNLVGKLGPEIYPGEISDRLRFAVKSTLSVADRIGLDQRSRVIFERVVAKLPTSPALAALSQDIARATKDPKRVGKELVSLLNRHGYFEKSDNKHVRMEAKESFTGLESITISKTPSEYRGLKNLAKQVERSLGISKLRD